MISYMGWNVETNTFIQPQILKNESWTFSLDEQIVPGNFHGEGHVPWICVKGNLIVESSVLLVKNPWENRFTFSSRFFGPLWMENIMYLCMFIYIYIYTYVSLVEKL